MFNLLGIPLVPGLDGLLTGLVIILVLWGVAYVGSKLFRKLYLDPRTPLYLRDLTQQLVTAALQEVVQDIKALDPKYQTGAVRKVARQVYTTLPAEWPITVRGVRVQIPFKMIVSANTFEAAALMIWTGIDSVQDDLLEMVEKEYDFWKAGCSTPIGLDGQVDGQPTDKKRVKPLP